ncbi:MAG: 50S ribosomal protein L10 [Candidatus Latescibacteria bacterium]|nr:50S ribosomal protein L10 [bacterium]MBD3425303.1 50S ribosomal protein L10 [Candidatus Latescibacterota bacterium]
MFPQYSSLVDDEPLRQGRQVIHNRYYQIKKTSKGDQLVVNQAKIDAVEELTELFKGAKSIVLNDYKGLNVEQVSELRSNCREKNVIFRVIKNTLAKRAFENSGLAEVESFLEGPTAVAISYEDEVVSAQVLNEFAGEYELPVFKGSIINGRVMDRDKTIHLASLPGKDELRAQVVGAFVSPVRGLVVVLDASRRNLVYVLNAIAEKKGAA